MDGNLVHRILSLVDDIDIRRAFQIPPRRLTGHRFTRYEYVYDNSTSTMFDFSGMKDPVSTYWIISRGIPFTVFRSPDLHVFNMEWDDYEMTLFSDGKEIGPSLCKNHLVIRSPVKFLSP